MLIGQRKTIYLRLINDKEINVEWSQNQRGDITQSEKKEDSKFLLVPNSGVIAPGDK